MPRGAGLLSGRRVTPISFRSANPTAPCGLLDVVVQLLSHFDSPDYQYFQAFTGRAMVMQAWSSYGVEWAIIYHYLGIRPDVPNGQLAVIPELPSSWPTLSVNKLRVGNGTIAVSAKQNGNQYTTALSAPTGYNVQLGYVIPAGTKPASVTLGGTAVKYQTIATSRGNEVFVQTPSRPNLSLVVTVGP